MASLHRSLPHPLQRHVRRCNDSNEIAQILSLPKLNSLQRCAGVRATMASGQGGKIGVRENWCQFTFPSKNELL
jgi:hypothetical protein